MSRDFYFDKWRKTLRDLEELMELDMDYQVSKTHDRTLPEARHRLSIILDQYTLLYNSASECLYQNLQVQKTEYMDSIVKAIVSRILELKRELEKLEGSNILFLGHATPEAHHTIFDAEMKLIPLESKRPEQIQIVMEETIARAREKKAEMERLANLPEEEEEEPEQTELTGWETKEEIKRFHEMQNKKKIEAIPEEIRKKTEYLCMIAAHEKTRQVTRSVQLNKLRREMWVKELTGTFKPPASILFREQSAKLIQKVFRVYFKLKREHIRNCRRDELLGLNICETPNPDLQRKAVGEMLLNRSKLYNHYEKEWIARRERLKIECLERKRDQLNEETRDQIREWFLEWFTEVQFFYDIPKDGAAAIFKGYVPSPQDWLEENKAQLLQIEANKKKSPQDLKFQKMEAKKQEQMLKKEEQMKKKGEALLMKKMMKNPTMHPGYYYPQSKKIDSLIQILTSYHKTWDYYDDKETFDVKEKFVHRIDVENAIKDAKIEVLPDVDEHMRKELVILKKALKADYITNREEMPVNVTKPIKGEKKQKKVKQTLTDKMLEIIETLVQQDFIIECPKTNIEDFLGDPNFGGVDLRSQIQPAFPFNFEIRSFWWERCREVTLGYRRILLVGPKYTGRSVLVNALASINDAVLIELNPHKVQGEMAAVPFLKVLIHNVLACAKALQPAVIHIKHVQKLFYTKTPPDEKEMNLGLLKTYFINKLMKKIRKTDKITIIATCTDPWLAKSSALLKQFPIVLLVPNSSYSLIVQILRDWIVRYKVLPADFNVSNLAYVLQGYTYGYLQQALENFMSADRIAKIAAFGIKPMDVYNFILADDTESKVEYDKFLTWYTEKTPWGQKETQHIQEQKDFRAAVEKYAAKKKKQAKSAQSSTTASHTTL